MIGNGMVGHRLIEQLQAQAGASQPQLTVICEERRLAYDRVHLSSHFDDPAPDLALATAEGYAQGGVQVVYGKAEAVDTEQKTVLVAGQSIAYNALVFATGSFPFVPPIPGKDAPGGIVIDDNCATSAPGVYAVGECALHDGRIYGLVAPGYSMAKVAAAKPRAAAPCP